MKSLAQLLQTASLLCLRHLKAVALRRDPSLEPAPLFERAVHLLPRKLSRCLLCRLPFSTRCFWTRSISTIRLGELFGSRRFGVFSIVVAGHQRPSKILEGKVLLQHLLILPPLLQRSLTFNLWLFQATHRGVADMITWMVWRHIFRKRSSMKRETGIWHKWPALVHCLRERYLLFKNSCSGGTFRIMILSKCGAALGWVPGLK